MSRAEAQRRGGKPNAAVNSPGREVYSLSHHTRRAEAPRHNSPNNQYGDPACNERELRRSMINSPNFMLGANLRASAPRAKRARAQFRVCLARRRGGKL